MQDPRDFPTAADYAQNAADEAHRRLARIEAALIEAGLMESLPPPGMGNTASMYASLKAHYDRVLADDDAPMPFYLAKDGK